MKRIICALATVAGLFHGASVRCDEPQAAVPPAPAGAQSSEAYAGTVGRLSLSALQQLARQHNPTLEQARAGTWEAHGRQVQAGLYPNPELAYTASEIGQDGKAGQQGFQIQQEFVTAGKLGLSQNVERWGQQEAQQALYLQQYRVDAAVRREFYQVLAAERLKSIAVDLVKIADRGKNITDARRERQEGTRIDQLQAQIELERAQLGLTVAEKQLDAAWRRLESIVGTRLSRESLDGDLELGVPDLDWETSLARTLQGNPQVQRARYAASRARAALSRAEVEPIPNVTVQAGSQYDAATNYGLANLQVSIPVPVFDRNQGNITAAQAAWIRSSREIERIELALQRDLAQAFREYEVRRAEAVRYHDAILPAAKETLELSQSAFEIGELTYIQLLTTQRTFTQSNREYIAALSRLWDAAIEVESMLITEGLQAPE